MGLAPGNAGIFDALSDSFGLPKEQRIETMLSPS